MKRTIIAVLLLSLFLAAALTACGQKRIEEPAGHDMGVWTVETRPTYKKNGTLTRKCLDDGCDHTERVALKASKGLSYRTENGKAYVCGAGSCRDRFLYISSKTPDGRTVAGVALGAFTDNGALRHVVIEDGVREVGGYAFSGCANLISAAMPEKTDAFEAGIFLSCSSLRAVKLPENLTELPESCFDGCTALRRVSIPENVTVLAHAAFNLCKSLEAVDLPNGLVTIGSGCFDSCAGLTGIKLPKTLKTIGTYAFAGCGKLTEMTVDAPLERLYECAFTGCAALRAVFLSKDIQTIDAPEGVSPFFGCAESLLISTDAPEKPDGWNEHFAAYFSEKTEDGIVFRDLTVLYGAAAPGH